MEGDQLTITTSAVESRKFTKKFPEGDSTDFEFHTVINIGHWKKLNPGKLCPYIAYSQFFKLKLKEQWGMDLRTCKAMSLDGGVTVFMCCMKHEKESLVIKCSYKDFKEDQDLTWRVTKALKCSCIYQRDVDSDEENVEDQEQQKLKELFLQLRSQLAKAEAKSLEGQQPYHFFKENVSSTCKKIEKLLWKQKDLKGDKNSRTVGINCKREIGEENGSAEDENQACSSKKARQDN